MQVFVTTYAIGNTQGFATGKWFDLSDYADKQVFLDDAFEYCVEVLGDKDPEICFADYDDIPKDLISEYHIDDAVFELGKLSNYELEVVTAYVVATGCDYSEAINKAFDNHIGWFADDGELGMYFFNLNRVNIPDDLIDYFDFDKYGKDMGMNLVTDGEHYFHY